MEQSQVQVLEVQEKIESLCFSGARLCFELSALASRRCLQMPQEIKYILGPPLETCFSPELGNISLQCVQHNANAANRLSRTGMDFPHKLILMTRQENEEIGKVMELPVFTATLLRWIIYTCKEEAKTSVWFGHVWSEAMIINLLVKFISDRMTVLHVAGFRKHLFVSDFL